MTRRSRVMSAGVFTSIGEAESAPKRKGGRASPPFERKLTDFEWFTYHADLGVRKQESTGSGPFPGPGQTGEGTRRYGGNLPDAMWSRAALIGLLASGGCTFDGSAAAHQGANP